MISVLLLTACPTSETRIEKENTKKSTTTTLEDDFSSEETEAPSLSKESAETTATATTTTEMSSSEISSETTSNEQSAFLEHTTESTSETMVPEEPVEKGFVVHYIDVGQGDSSLIICDGQAMLIDGGASDQSDLIYAYLKKYDISKLKYIVGTHPDDDHIGGLSGALNFATVERAFCSVDEYDSKPFSSFQKYLNKQKVVLEIPQAGTELELGSAKVQFIAPRTKLDDTNNNSIVIRVVYGNTSFLFAGDAEFDEETSILNAKVNIESDILKVGHHGSEYSTSDGFLKAVNPVLAVISCGTDNSYGFPTQKVLDKLKKNDIDLLRTDKHGDILIYSNGEDLEYETEKETTDDLFLAPGTLDPEPEGQNDCSYIVNTNTGKFHYPNCSAVKKMKEKNKWYYDGSRDDLIEMGYDPCKICKP